MITQAADLHFAPTRLAADRLRAEGVAPERVVETGNTVVDALFATIERDLPFQGPEALALQEIERSPTLLVTAHRRESWDGGSPRSPTPSGRSSPRIRSCGSSSPCIRTPSCAPRSSPAGR
nr:UDP-N-acetylglucosamine 2-epimerase [Microbacterium sp. NIBRBAC000506063]